MADPGFDLRGCVDFVNRGGGGGLKIVESIDDLSQKSFLACFLAYFY